MILSGPQERLDAVLDPREQKILRLHLGLEDGRSHSNGEIGMEVGLTKERVRQIRVRAISKVRKAMSHGGTND